MVRDGKPKGFFYLDHRTVDGKLALITDTHVTPANVHDSIVYLDRLDRQRERFGFDVGAVLPSARILQPEEPYPQKTKPAEISTGLSAV
ncbi:hypothetical protein SAMN05216228_1008138 [Rhizobium tibeticum]|uniref:Transposase n=1 Tax=Rhizobium tibeticum TaxID=501024 RepID=A0A1H8K1F9_9HYPH|nr:hypothetical protein RTCCBAU85039_2320 [Rhizobium tibeticum]SEN86611.1 hypothetical protein SAMN05216228_1008138 [Rhizobium tibeticum]